MKREIDKLKLNIKTYERHLRSGVLPGSYPLAASSGLHVYVTQVRLQPVNASDVTSIMLKLSTPPGTSR
jgi:hypothetical protein